MMELSTTNNDRDWVSVLRGDESRGLSWVYICEKEKLYGSKKWGT
jgi:hypothetical protein